MTIHKINNVELNDTEINTINEIKELKTKIDGLCETLVSSLYNNSKDVETAHDILYYSNITDIVGRINVNKIIKTKYKIKI